MNRDAVLSLIAATRALLDTVELLIDGREAEAKPGPCEHPEDKRELTGAFSAPHEYLCRSCMSVVNPDAPEGQE